MPPSSYVRYDNVSHRCVVAIINSGPRRVLYGYETVVLGEPFFRSATVVLDLERRRVGLGASPGGNPFGAAGDVEVAQGGDGQWQPPSGVGAGDGPAEDHCPCADPK